MMKRIVHAMFSAAVAATLAACASTAAPEEDLMRQAIIEDIDVYMNVYGESIEIKPTEYSSESAKDIFEQIPAIQQQQKFRYFSYDMESNDGKVVVRSLFAPGEKMKLIFSDEKGKVLLSLILNDRKVYRSTNGIEYKQGDAKLAVGLRFLYDSTMKFPDCAKKVSVRTFDAYRYSKGDRKTFAEPQEVMIDDVRCYQLDVNFRSNTYAADLILYVASDDSRNLVRVESKPKAGLQGTAQEQSTTNSRFFYMDDFVFPGLTQVKNSKGVSEMTMKNITVNREIPESEFTPDVLI